MAGMLDFGASPAQTDHASCRLIGSNAETFVRGHQRSGKLALPVRSAHCIICARHPKGGLPRDKQMRRNLFVALLVVAEAVWKRALGERR